MDSISPPQLAPLKGPLHLYGQRALGQTSPTPEGQSAPIQSLPGALVPKQLPPVSATGQPKLPVMRSLSVLAPPALPPIGEQGITSSSDENVTSTSETEGGGITSEGSRPGQLSRRPSFQSPLPGVLKPPPLRQPSVPVLPPLPSMPSRRVSTDPFATVPPPLERTPTTLSLTRPMSQIPSELRRPALPSIRREEDSFPVTTETEMNTTTSDPASDTGTD